MKILVADDDSTSRLMLRGILSKWGDKEIITVADGHAAWQILEDPATPMIAILDWEMPGIDGVELCRMVKARSNPQPIHLILLTGRQTKDDIVLGLNSGADDYITKPFNNGELRARIGVAERLVNAQLSLSRKIEELAEALKHVKTLQGIIPICMHCHKIRVDEEAWHRIEAYIEDHSDAHFSHGICPECLEKYYP
ncbi:MAG: response regulator transcription factor [Desulfobulbaceae bacterium]|jgi:DNA-binding response OmpR family regulator|nr:response regulator transcription factor [Desulfobulbaceae bacterium]